MQIGLRRGFGYAYNPFRGMRGLGDDTTTLDIGGGYVGAPLNIVSSSPTEGIAPGVTYNALIAQGVDPTDAAAYDPLGACAADPNCSMPIDPLSTIIPAGTAAGAMTGALPTPAQLAAGNVSSFTPAQIAAALKAGTLIAAATSGVATPGRPICPSGVAYPTGQCMPASSSIFGGAPLIAGVSNTALAFVAVAFLGLMLMGGKRR